MAAVSDLEVELSKVVIEQKKVPSFADTPKSEKGRWGK